MLDEWLRYKVYKKGRDLGVSNADWVSLDGELHLSVVHCCSCSSFQFCNTFIGDLRLRPCAASCVCILSTSVTSVRSGGTA